MALTASLLCAATAVAQDNRDIEGSYSGEIGPLAGTLHLRVRPDGTLTATLDNLDLNAPWMFTCSEVHRDGQSLAFIVPSIQASFRGTFSNDAGELTGTWSQKGGSRLITFTRRKFVPATRPSALDGIWLGTLPVGNDPSSRIQVVFRSDAAGREYCTLDALDVYYMDLECANVAWDRGVVSFDVPVAGMHWNGKLDTGGTVLDGHSHARVVEGSSTKDVETVLNFSRQKTLSLEKTRNAATYDTALPPVSASDLASVLAVDLTGVLKSGALAASTGQGVSIGVYTHGVSSVFAFGAAKPDSIFEIGSLTRPFTGLLLVEMAAEHKVELSEPVRELLPAGSVKKPDGQEITLLDLASQRSGLPAMPDNISTANLDQPYADYHFSDLLKYLEQRGVANPGRTPSTFGTLGFGLLGAVLADVANEPYGRLIHDEIAAPLGMTDTAIELSADQQARFIPGHDQYRGHAQAWTSDALAGAIALRSTAPDMLSFLVANLHPERVARDHTSRSILPDAIRRSLETEAEVSPGMRVALGWLYQDETGNYWHNGATAAYSAYAFFNPKGISPQLSCSMARRGSTAHSSRTWAGTCISVSLESPLSR